MSCSFPTLSSDHIYPKKQLLLGGPDLSLRQDHKTRFDSLPRPINLWGTSSCLPRSRSRALRTEVRSPPTRFTQPLPARPCGDLPRQPSPASGGAEPRAPRVADLCLKHPSAQPTGSLAQSKLCFRGKKSCRLLSFFKNGQNSEY